MSKSNIIQFSLNSEVIKYLPFDKYDKDFAFIVDALLLLILIFLRSHRKSEVN